jgi:hypothetical protein
LTDCFAGGLHQTHGGAWLLHPWHGRILLPDYQSTRSLALSVQAAWHLTWQVVKKKNTGKTMENLGHANPVSIFLGGAIIASFGL